MSDDEYYYDGCDCHASAQDHLQAAYDEVVNEYSEYRSSTRARISDAEQTIRRALEGTRTGNMLTPPWVIDILSAYPHTPESENSRD